ncbi:PAS domain S-box-containing protein [Altererythrobacter atlanticus]|uniref:histidine kinase n=1 Tax=Croceibacterium atlanticum TaxID=1267766 RepID=A0A0F7KSG0_9SPHN|nr:PAS domain S-box protein [Croceibacterium atlanticum]AKH42207.1 Blue-light-activated histidine kinase [Croceibacterium atlanticum]MBB5733981.1 PAS domain S-box-containing protein [Croceibacterium atlanticum]
MIEVRDLYAALIESSDDAIVAKDTDGIVNSWNPAAEKLFGYSAEEMIGQSIRILIPADLQEEEDLILSRIRNGERVDQFFTKRRHKSGRLLDVSVAVSPVRNSEGRIVGASKIARDAQPYLENQRRLRESEERFRMLAENMSQLAWIARPDGQIFWYNKRWYDFTGTTLEQVEGWGWADIHHPDHLQQVEEHYRSCLARGVDWEDTFPLRGRDGEYRWFLSRAKPIRGDDGKIVNWFGTNTDITDQREQEEQIRLLLMEVNHRSKNMLSTVQALARRTARDDAGFIARFEDRVRSLAVNQDILVRRDWREVPVDELVHHQLHFIDQAVGEVDITGPPCALKPRAAEVIGMALHELATNSLKYGAMSAKGGHVDIGWSCPPDTGGFSIWWRETGGPEVEEPEQAGFGTTLIREVPRHNLCADVTLDYRPQGLCWEVSCDDSVLARLVQPGAA